MANPVTSSSILTPFLAAEYLVQQIGVEAAQVANIPESIFVQYIYDMSTLSAHLRNEVVLDNPGAADEATSLPTVEWDPAGTVITAGLDGQSVILSKVVNALTGDALASIAKQQGTSLGRSIDSALCSLFPSLTAGTVDGSGSNNTLTVLDIITANANLDAQHAEVAGPYEGRLHPHQFQNLYGDIMSKNFGIAKVTSDAQGKDVINIGETILKKNTLIDSLTSSGGLYEGAVYSSQAMALVIAQTPSVEILPIPGSHSFSIDATVVYGVGVWRPKFGALVQSSRSH